MRHALLALVVGLVACGGSRSAAGRATRGSADRSARAMSLSEQRRAEGDELLAIVARAAGARAADVVPVGAVGDKGISGQAHFIRKYFSQRPAIGYWACIAPGIERAVETVIRREKTSDDRFSMPRPTPFFMIGASP